MGLFLVLILVLVLTTLNESPPAPNDDQLARMEPKNHFFVIMTLCTSNVLSAHRNPAKDCSCQPTETHHIKDSPPEPVVTLITNNVVSWTTKRTRVSPP